MHYLIKTFSFHEYLGAIFTLGEFEVAEETDVDITIPVNFAVAGQFERMSTVTVKLALGEWNACFIVLSNRKLRILFRNNLIAYCHVHISCFLQSLYYCGLFGSKVSTTGKLIWRVFQFGNYFGEFY